MDELRETSERLTIVVDVHGIPKSGKTQLCAEIVAAITDVVGPSGRVKVVHHDRHGNELVKWLRWLRDPSFIRPTNRGCGALVEVNHRG